MPDAPVPFEVMLSVTIPVEPEIVVGMIIPYAVYEPLLVNLITVYAPLVVMVGEPVVVPV